MTSRAPVIPCGRWTATPSTRLADEGGIVAPTGPPGDVVLFHGNLVHASPPNISPWRRAIVYLSLCEVNNHIRRFKRPEFIAHRDFAPIEPLADDCLLELVEQESRPARVGIAMSLNHLLQRRSAGQEVPYVSA